MVRPTEPADRASGSAARVGTRGATTRLRGSVAARSRGPAVIGPRRTGIARIATGPIGIGRTGIARRRAGIDPRRRGDAAALEARHGLDRTAPGRRNGLAPIARTRRRRPTTSGLRARPTDPPTTTAAIRPGREPTARSRHDSARAGPDRAGSGPVRPDRASRSPALRSARSGRSRRSRRARSSSRVGGRSRKPSLPDVPRSGCSWCRSGGRHSSSSCCTPRRCGSRSSRSRAAR